MSEGGRVMANNKIPVIPEPNTKPLPSTKKDIENFERFQKRFKPVNGKKNKSKEKKKKVAEQTAETEFKIEQDKRLKDVLFDLLKNKIEQDVLEESYEKSGKSDQKGNPKFLMRKKYQERASKGGYIKKYAKGGGVRKVRS